MSVHFMWRETCWILAGRKYTGVRLRTFELRPRCEHQRPSFPTVREQYKRGQAYAAREDDLGGEPGAFELVCERKSDKPPTDNESVTSWSGSWWQSGTIVVLLV